MNSYGHAHQHSPETIHETRTDTCAWGQKTTIAFYTEYRLWIRALGSVGMSQNPIGNTEYVVRISFDGALQGSVCRVVVVVA